MTSVHPDDLDLVNRWADSLTGRVLDAGCGPGHWTDHLARRGLDVRGIDLAPAFIARARATYPGLRFDVGSIESIDEPDGALGGVLAWFSTIHHPPGRISVPLAEFARVLSPGGSLALGFFEGPAVEQFDHAVAPAHRWPTDDLADALTRQGFDIVETRQRADPGQRPVGAILARRSGRTSRPSPWIDVASAPRSPATPDQLRSSPSQASAEASGVRSPAVDPVRQRYLTSPAIYGWRTRRRLANRIEGWRTA